MLSEYQYIQQCGAAQSLFLPLGQPLNHNLKTHIALNNIFFFAISYPVRLCNGKTGVSVYKTFRSFFLYKRADTFRSEVLIEECGGIK
jgi:hypothetical protein